MQNKYTKYIRLKNILKMIHDWVQKEFCAEKKNWDLTSRNSLQIYKIINMIIFFLVSYIIISQFAVLGIEERSVEELPLRGSRGFILFPIDIVFWIIR